MKARILWMKLPELWWPFDRRIVCLVDGELRYVFGMGDESVVDRVSGKSFSPVYSDAVEAFFPSQLQYALPGGDSLRIEKKKDFYGVYAGHSVEERWPVSTRRELVCGDRVFAVNPEDDTLSFDWLNQPDDLRSVIIGFWIYSRSAERGMVAD